MKNISFSITTHQFRDRSKTVTRRMGWTSLKPGDLLCGIVKGMGLKLGEKVERLGTIRVVTVRQEPLWRITEDDVLREGFPLMSRNEFMLLFCKHHKPCTHDTIVTRIEFEYVD